MLGTRSEVSASNFVTMVTPTKLSTIPSTFSRLMRSMEYKNPIISVKNDDVVDKMVWEATEVYDNDALVTRLAPNHKEMNWSESLTVSYSEICSLFAASGSTMPAKFSLLP